MPNAAATAAGRVIAGSPARTANSPGQGGVQPGLPHAQRRLRPVRTGRSEPRTTISASKGSPFPAAAAGRRCL